MGMVRGEIEHEFNIALVEKAMQVRVGRLGPKAPLGRVRPCFHAVTHGDQLGRRDVPLFGVLKPRMAH